VRDEHHGHGDDGQAYGGTTFAKNPLGRGAKDETIEGKRVRSLSNIESWHDRIQLYGQKVDPTSLGMVDITWQQRIDPKGGALVTGQSKCDL
jgi:hypothetical protein